jgi:hypothetical protein
MASKEEQRQFSALIETIVKDKRMTYLDAIIFHCEQIGFEIELAATLLTTPIKSKINDEAQAGNMIKKVRQLPL